MGCARSASEPGWTGPTAPPPSTTRRCAARVKANTEALEGLGHWGVPLFAFEGELFWGQDRIDDVATALRGGGTGALMAAPSQPNLVLLITDQQRAPQHWPAEPGWLDALMPNDAELRRTGMSFTRAFIATAMCSPSRASMLTGTYPSRHGVTLTLTEGDLFPDPKNVPDVLRDRGAAWPRAARCRAARLAEAFGRGAAAARAEERQRARAARRASPRWRRCCASAATTSRSRASGT